MTENRRKDTFRILSGQGVCIGVTDTSAMGNEEQSVRHVLRHVAAQGFIAAY
jgi:hypothetical protein